MDRSFYSDTIAGFMAAHPDLILGSMADANRFELRLTQRDAWRQQITLLKRELAGLDGQISFEYTVPRLGKRIDTVLLIGPIVFVIEFKMGAEAFTRADSDQVWDYALDLKNFHGASHDAFLVPILIASNASFTSFTPRLDHDNVFAPIHANAEGIGVVIRAVLNVVEGNDIDGDAWHAGRYHPTPTIVEAALALYGGHAVEDISRSDAGAVNLTTTSESISQIIERSKVNQEKAICFVTGVPGAGKTLVGLNIATRHFDPDSELYSVFLSGNGPLVNVLREALARDNVRRSKELGEGARLGESRSKVKAFIQNVHNFRDDCLTQLAPPIEHVVLFDEAQRAWNITKTADFMKRKRNRPNFSQSEPEFLISCMDRHQDWAVIVCLIGGGQEINTGEAGIGEWLRALGRSFRDWRVYISDKLTDAEFDVAGELAALPAEQAPTSVDNLHLSVSMRSFRAENVSLFVKQVLDREDAAARETFGSISPAYPIALTRDLAKAKEWLRQKARGSERYGILVSSAAERLRPHAIHVKAPMDPVHWFLDSREDVRSSYYLEDVATEFQVQGLELDWACVVWDADFRYAPNGWSHHSFCGERWNRVHKEERKMYQTNAYRVLMTRARQGMVIVVPEGDVNDPTRRPEFYDGTWNFLAGIGAQRI